MTITELASRITIRLVTDENEALRFHLCVDDVVRDTYCVVIPDQQSLEETLRLVGREIHTMLRRTE
jgi:hypothetical protein